MSTQVSTAKIVHSYIDFDGVTVDIVERKINGKAQTRSCWTVEDNFEGEVIHYLVSRSGQVLPNNWRTTANNEWLKAYVSLWYQRLDAQTKPPRDAKEQEEIARAAELARADLGWGW